MTMKESSTKRNIDPLEHPEVRWGVGCLLGTAALIGMMVITAVIVFAFEPPAWVQVLMGLGITAGGVGLGLLIVKSIESSKTP
jgi:hypothetical protein